MAISPPPLPRADVSFLDLWPAHASLKDALLSDLGALIDSGAFTNGPDVGEFEREFAAWTGSRACIGLGSGLDALRLGLLGAGLEPGDEVLVPANTFVATLEAVTQAGGLPVLVDASERDLNIDVAAARLAVGPKTRFLLPVHLYGQLADLRALAALASECGLGIVEDACQAHGAVRDGLTPGMVGAAAAYSFYPGKNLGAFGDAGALVTADDGLAERVRALREHGQRRKYVHEWEGWTARLDTIQALVLRRKLPLLDGWNEERRAAAACYDAALAGVGDLVLPPVPAGSEPAWHLYVVRTAAPEALGEHLRAAGIATGRHYPTPVHLAPAYAWLGHRRGDFPVSELLAEQCLSLPLYPGIAPEQLDAVSEAVRAFFARG
jgi:dTDP-4-amino-4,6-dideoxygalactose transaminase